MSFNIIIKLVLSFLTITILHSSDVKQKNEILDKSNNTYFISPSGDNKNSGKTPQNAFKTIQHAINFARANETIILLKGKYYEDIKSIRSGKKDKPIKIMGMNGAILKGKKRAYIFEINHSYIELINFTIDGKEKNASSQNNYRDKLIYIKGKKNIGVTGIKIVGMKLQNALGECIRIKYFASNNEVAYNIIQNCGIRDFVFKRGKKNGESIYIGTAPKQIREGKNPTKDIDTSHQNWIHHNTIISFGSECIDIKEGSHHNIIEHNICTNQMDPNLGGISIRGNNNIVRNNIIFDNTGVGIRTGGNSINDGIENNIYENYLSNNKQGALKIMSAPNKNEICGNQIFTMMKQKKVRTKSGQKIIIQECKEK